MALSKRHKGVIITIAAAFIFGFYPACTKGLYAEGGNNIFMIILSTWLRACALGILCLGTHQAVFKNKGSFKDALVGGVIQAASIFGLLSSIAYIPGPVSVVIVSTYPLMILLFMAWKGETRLTAPVIGVTLLALLGLTFVLDVWRQSASSLVGIGLAAFAALATASRIYVFSVLTKTRNPAVVGTEVFTIAALATLALAAVQMPVAPVSGIGWLWAFGGSLALALGSIGVFYGVALLGPFEFGLIIKLDPVFATVFSALLVGDVLNWHQYAGMALVMGSLVAYQVIEARRTKVKTLVSSPEAS